MSDLEELDLKKSDLEESNLKKSDLEESNLKKSDLEGSLPENVVFWNQMTRMVIENPELIRVQDNYIVLDDLFQAIETIPDWNRLITMNFEKESWFSAADYLMRLCEPSQEESWDNGLTSYWPISSRHPEIIECMKRAIIMNAFAQRYSLKISPAQFSEESFLPWQNLSQEEILKAGQLCQSYTPSAILKLSQYGSATDVLEHLAT